jgi:hypothetical protein
MNEQATPAEPSNESGQALTVEQRLLVLETGALGLFDVVRLTGLGVLLSLCLVAAGYVFASKNNLLPDATNTKVVYLDFEKVMGQAIKQVAERGHLSIENTKLDAQQFQQHISKVLMEYGQSGHVVINKRALIEGTPGADITQEVMQKLGLIEAPK